MCCEPVRVREKTVAIFILIQIQLKIDEPERDDYKIDLQLDEMELELFIIKNCPKRPSYPEAYGLRHLAFAVDSVDNTVRELNKRGIITEPIRLDIYTGKRMTFFYDPDNLPLEIHE